MCIQNTNTERTSIWLYLRLGKLDHVVSNIVQQCQRICHQAGFLVPPHLVLITNQQRQHDAKCHENKITACHNKIVMQQKKSEKKHEHVAKCCERQQKLSEIIHFINFSAS